MNPGYAEKLRKIKEDKEANVARIVEMLESHGIKMNVWGCGCCDSPYITIECDGEIVSENNASFYMGAGDK